MLAHSHKHPHLNKGNKMTTNEKVFVYDQEDIKAILESQPEHSMTYEDGFTHGYDAYLADYKEQPTQKPLSDEEIEYMWEILGDIYNFARAIEKRILAGI